MLGELETQSKGEASFPTSRIKKHHSIFYKKHIPKFWKRISGKTNEGERLFSLMAATIVEASVF